MIQEMEIRGSDREAILGSRVLIIDDQLPNVLLLEKILQYYGYRNSRAVTDSREAIHMFQEFQPDLILLDLTMPEIDGYAILTELRPLIDKDSYLPILVITADASQQAKQRALSLGAKDFIAKPIDATETILRIDNLLKTRWLYRQIRHQAEDLMETNSHLSTRNRELTALRDQIAGLMIQAGGELSGEGDRVVPSAAMGPEAMLARIGALITARKQLEEQLRQSQKMEAMGRLAAGIAHDFNNLLSVIIGYNDLLRRELDQSPAAHEHAEEVSKAASRASALTKQLLAFSRQQVARPRVIELNDVVQQLEKMLRHVVEAHVQIQIVAGAAVFPIKMDPAQVDQILMNLVVNARDAMPKGGRLTIETGTAQIGEGEIDGAAGLRPGPYATLIVTDTGTGMSAETQERLFEPFFTTKEKGRGTGLGLSIVHGIVSQNGGGISVESEVGRGTTFRVYLPATDEQAGEPLFTEPPEVTAAVTETILLVEDDEPVRRLVREILAREGYQVWESISAPEALQRVRENPAGISMLLTDLVMPSMNGIDLAAEVSRLQPAIRVLFMSGYAGGDIASALRPETAILEKPFTAASLLQSIRQVLA